MTALILARQAVAAERAAIARDKRILAALLPSVLIAAGSVSAFALYVLFTVPL